MLAELPRDQEVAGDRALFARRVAGKLDDLHAIEKGPGDRALLVGRRDEHHLAEIERDVEVVIGELVVLLGVEHFEKRARRITPLVAAELVDLVEDDDGVLAACLLQRGDDPARERTDVRAPVTAHFGFVRHAAERHTGKRAARCSRNGAAERSLANTGRPDEAENRRAPVAPELSNRDVLDDASLGLFEPVVIFVEHLAGLRDVEAIGGLLRPWEVGEPLDVGARDLVLAAGGVHVGHAPKLALGGRFCVCRQTRERDSFAEVFDVVLIDVGFAELSTNRLDLLPEEILALRAGHFLLDHRRDLLFDPNYLVLAVHLIEHAAHALADVERFENRLFGLVAEWQIRGDEIGQRSGLANVVEDVKRFARCGGQVVEELSRRLAKMRRQGLDLDVDDRSFVIALHTRAHRRMAPEWLLDPHPADALKDHAVLSGVQPDDLEHARDRPRVKHLIESRVFHLGLVLCHDPDRRPLAAAGLLDEPHRAGTADVDGHDGGREEHRVAEG